jgi:hypothetical protein
MTLMELALGEMHSRLAYLADLYTPFFVCSYAAHCFNLLNFDKEIYWEGKRLPSMRLHLIFVAPPGYMKTFYMTNMGGPDCGIFANSKVQIGFRQSMTEAGLIGTVRMYEDIPYTTEGVAKTYENGILMIDEFSAITSAFKVNYNNQMDSQLLALLDHGRVYKDLAGGSIEYTSKMTLWGGVQPARYDFTSGMGRRMCFLLFLPTRNDNDILLDVMDKTRNIRIDKVEMAKLWTDVDKWCDSLHGIKSVTFDESVIKTYKELRLNSYETSLFDRLLIGYNLATQPIEDDIVVSVKDDKILEMMHQQKSWRDSIVRGLPSEQIKKMIIMSGVIIDDHYTMKKSEIIEESTMLGWNAGQVSELLLEMVKTGMVKLKNGTVILEE